MKMMRRHVTGSMVYEVLHLGIDDDDDDDEDDINRFE
jgi:hypothetical protein